MIFRKINIILIIVFIISFLINAEDNTNDPNRELIWKRLKETDSKLPVEIKDDMIANLIDYFNNDLSEEARLNSNFDHYGLEREYYFNNDNIFKLNSSFNDEFLCYTSIDALGRYQYYAYCNSAEPISNYSRLDVWWKVVLTIDSNRGANKHKIIVKKDNISFEGGYWYKCRVDPFGNGEEHAIYNIDKKNPIIYKYIFVDSPKKHYYTDYDDDSKTKAGSYKDEREKWYTKDDTAYVSKALSPLPRLNEYVLKQFDNSDDTHNKFIFDTDIVTDYNVKILYLKFYKFDEQSGKYLDDSANNPDIINAIEPGQHGLDYIKITRKINDIPLVEKARFSKEGRYMMVLGAVDKFNKIYTYEPEYFLLDFSAPVVTGHVISEEMYFTNDDPVIADLSNVEVNDTYTDYSNLDWSEYLYIVEKSTGVPVKIKNSSDLYFDDKRIKIKNENININIDELYILDKAGNKSNLLIDDKEYLWDKTKPEIKLSSSINPESYLSSGANLSFDIKELSRITVNNISVKLDNVESSAHALYPSSFNDLLIIDLKKFKNLEGQLEVLIDVSDEAGNQSIENFVFKFDDNLPEILAKVNNIDLYSYFSTILNEDIQFEFQVNDNNFNRLELDFESNSNFRKDKILYKAHSIYDLEKVEDVSIEDLSLNINVYDNAGNVKKIENIKIKIISDSNPPEIIVTQDPVIQWKYIIEVFDNEEDSSVGKVYYKQIQYDEINDIDMSDFGALPPYSYDWTVIGQNIPYFRKEIDILPKHAVCIIAEDAWGNVTQEGIILANQMLTYTEIKSRADLDNLPVPWELSGEVLISTDIEIMPSDHLRIVTNNTGQTIINFNSSVEKYKIVNLGGNITIDSTSNEIIFKGVGENNNDYLWFGIINKSGNISINNINKIYFQDAVAGLTYKQPEGDISLNNIEFKDCKIGIHLFDDSNSYNKLNIDNAAFINMIYGVKFDIVPPIDTDQYLTGFPYLSDNNIIIDNIKRGHIYCPIKGLLNFQNFNSSPAVENLEIIGSTIVGQILSINYSFIDDDAQDLTGTTYQWYVSNNKQGPYSSIPSAINDNWTITSDTVGKWIRMRIIPKDINGGIGTAVYSNPVRISNQSPTINSLTLIGNTTYGSVLTADYQYTDPENDNEGQSIYKWYFSDSENGTYTELEGVRSKSWTISSFIYSAKWIKVKVTPVDDKGSIGSEIESSPVQVNEFSGPFASNVFITGTIIQPGENITGTYTFSDTDDYLEGESIYDWLISDTEFGTYTSMGHNSKTLTIEPQFMGRWIKFTVIPKNEIEIIGEIKESLALKIEDLNLDEYDNQINNNTFDDAANIGEVNYNAVQTLTIKGFINISESDRDFFIFTVKDPLSGAKNYDGRNLHLRIKFIKNPDNAYGIKIWQGKTGLDGHIDANPNTTENPGDTIYRQFDWGLNTGDYHETTTNFENTYVIEVVKHGVIEGIDLMYEIEVSNGKYIDFNLEQ